MPDKLRVRELLEQMLDSDRSAEEVCSGDPALLHDVRLAWEQYQFVTDQIEAIFPTHNPAASRDSASREAADQLPQVDGYHIECVLGYGGIGVVYQARHLKLDRIVALKMLLAGIHAGPQDRARFTREAEAVAALRHPNIAQVYDAGEADGRPYFTMELVEGGSLSQKLAGTPQPAREAAQLVSILAGAVQSAHECGIVHRDLKPGNVLLAADGSPRITDFGLARRLENDAGLTRTGDAVGTPSYMAPEQARGEAAEVGPAADIYALGAILYECLTGRPPFKGETGAETVFQVINQDPVAPSRLNLRAPRDLETICLKCLHKEPGRRYASAAALADDLRRFGEGRPIQARPVGRGERLWRWGRRNPTAAALLATALALVGLASGGGVWLVQQRARHDAEMRNDVGTAVAQAERLRKGFHFREARELLEQARQRLEPAGSSDLRRQVDQGLADLYLAERLDAARVKAATARRPQLNLARVELLYASAFAEAGLGREGDDVEAVAANVQKSAVSEEVVAALDDWAAITRDGPRREWLLAVARKADPDLARARLRQPDLWNDGKQLANLPEDLKVAALSPEMATALGRVLRMKDMDAVPLLTAAQKRARQDFRLNLELGLALDQGGRSEEAVGHLRAALAVRPESSAAYNGLGTALFNLGRRKEAGEHFEEALRLDPRSAEAHQNLGVVLQVQGRLDEAIDHFEQALSIEPHFAWAHSNLGSALAQMDRLDEAIDHFGQALRLDPNPPDPKVAAVDHTNLGHALHIKGRLDEALKHLQEAIRLDPRLSSAHVNLGNALRGKGRLDEGIDHLQEAVRLNPKIAVAHHDLAAALVEKGRLEEAIDRFQQALTLDPKLAVARTGLSVSLVAATRAALWAAAGQGSEKGPVSESERARLRAKSLGWLRAHLELAAKMRNDGQPLIGLLTSWQTDPYLASVRDPAELAKLPAAERGQWQRLWADVAALIAADPAGQGQAFAARGDWAKAADCYARALKRGPADEGNFWFEYAALLLLSGDRPGYMKACAQLVDRCGKDKGPRSYHVARACTLAPDAVADMSLPGRLAEKELRGSREFWSLTEQGALAYRAGRFQEAVPPFEQSLRADPLPGRAMLNWLWLSLGNQRLGKTEEARRWLDKAQSWLDQFKDGMPARAEQEFGLDFHNWLEAHVLRREGEALIQSTGPRTRPENR